MSQRGEWAIAYVHLPKESPEPLGILLCDADNRLHVKFRRDWTTILADEPDIDLFTELAQDFEEKGRELGGSWVLEWLENSASHAIRIGPREAIDLAVIEATLAQLYEEHVRSATNSALSTAT